MVIACSFFMFALLIYEIHRFGEFGDEERGMCCRKQPLKKVPEETSQEKEELAKSSSTSRPEINASINGADESKSPTKPSIEYIAETTEEGNGKGNQEEINIDAIEDARSSQGEEKEDIGHGHSMIVT